MSNNRHTTPWKNDFAPPRDHYNPTFTPPDFIKMGFDPLRLIKMAIPLKTLFYGFSPTLKCRDNKVDVASFTMQTFLAELCWETTDGHYLEL